MILRKGNKREDEEEKKKEFVSNSTVSIQSFKLASSTKWITFIYTCEEYTRTTKKRTFFFCGNWDKKDCLKKFGGSSDLKRCNNGIVKIMVSAGFLFPRWNKIRRID